MIIAISRSRKDNMTELIVTIVLCILITIDIIVNIAKLYKQQKLWNLIRKGELSYIKTLDAYAKLHGYAKE